MAASRLPCPQCGTLNYPQDAQCLGCGCRFTPRPAAAPIPTAPRYAPDEMCPRCYGVLLPAAQFDTAGLSGGIATDSFSLSTPNIGARELAGTLGFLDMLAQILLGGIQAKLFERRLRDALKAAPQSLCCPSCHHIVRR